jgi:uncharacterized coiled-coil DUF342 family protein
MARTAIKTEAVSQLATLPERVAVVEEKAHQIEEKIDDLKVDVKEMHDCLDQTRDRVLEQLNKMTEEYRTNAANYYKHAEELNDKQTVQHDELAGKIKELQSIKDKSLKYGLAILAFLAGTGWVHAMNLPTILKFLGL